MSALLCCGSHWSSSIGSCSLDRGRDVVRVGNLVSQLLDLLSKNNRPTRAAINQHTTCRVQTSNSRHGGYPLSRARTISPDLNDFASAGPVFLTAAPPFVFFGAPAVEARAIFFLGCSAATVEEGRVLEDAGFAPEASAA